MVGVVQDLLTGGGIDGWPGPHRIEARVPFLDRDFLDECMTLDPLRKMCHQKNGGQPVTRRCMEKYIIRQAFEVKEGEKPYLPEHILWRQKEQFSDGVGYGWIDGLRDYAESQVTDRQLTTAGSLFPEATPTTKEGYLHMTCTESVAYLWVQPRLTGMAAATTVLVLVFIIGAGVGAGSLRAAWSNLREACGVKIQR